VVTIAAHVHDSAARARLRGAVRSHAKLVFCDDLAELASAVADGAATAVITEWRDDAGGTIESAIRALRIEYPNIPVLVYAPLTPEGAHDMLAAARAGAVDVIIANFDDVGITLGRRLASAQATTLADRIVERLATLVPLPVAQMLEYFFRHARTPPSVGGAAAALQVHRKTLALHCARARLPSPSALCCWARLILTSHRLEDPGRTTEHGAIEMGFPSGSAFRNMLKRYTGLSPAEVRERGGSMCLVEMLTAQLAQRSPGLYAGRRRTRRGTPKLPRKDDAAPRGRLVIPPAQPSNREAVEE
jgi:AraC-like DNA-binding protein